MEKRENKECEVYFGERIVLGLPGKRRTFYRRIGAVVAFLLFAALAFFVARSALETDSGAVDTNSVSEGEVLENTKGNEDPFESETAFGTEEIEGEKGSEGDDTAAEEETDGREEGFGGVVSLDLSRKEMGDSFLINYSKLNPDAEGILEMGFDGGRSFYSEKPVVLILHAHTSETYYDSDPTQPLHKITKSVVAVGERVAYELNRRGVPTVHCTVIHDADRKVYENVKNTVEAMMKIYPSIEYVIDLNRLETTDGEGRVIRTLSSLETAQVRLTVSSEGALVRDALALALNLRRDMNGEGKNLCMPVVFTDSPYCAESSRYYLKVDVGSAGNSADEAVEAGALLAEALAEILKK